MRQVDSDTSGGLLRYLEIDGHYSVVQTDLPYDRFHPTTMDQYSHSRSWTSCSRIVGADKSMIATDKYVLCFGACLRETCNIPFDNIKLFSQLYKSFI